jgi:hypothetical protein
MIASWFFIVLSVLLIVFLIACAFLKNSEAVNVRRLLLIKETVLGLIAFVALIVLLNSNV